MTYPSKLSEQLKVAQAYNDKLKVLEQFLNVAMLKIEEHEKHLDTHSDAISDLQAAQRLLDASVDERLKRKPAVVTNMTAKAMCHKLGIINDHVKYNALKFFAERFCKEHDLPFSKGQGTKKHPTYPIEAAKWAMEQVK
jgi:hypothetical protein